MLVLKSLLEGYNPSDPAEVIYKSQMLEILKNCSDCFNRSCRVGHFTGSSWLLDKTEERFFMMHHKKLDIWLQSGGHADGNENLLEVAIKEAEEESGLSDIKAISDKIFDIDVHLFPKIKNDDPHYHFDVRFLLKYEGDEELKINDESNMIKWFSRDEFNMKDHSSVSRMFNKWVSIS